MAIENLNTIEPDQSDPFMTGDEEVIIPPFSESSGLPSRHCNGNRRTCWYGSRSC